jgi:hypothetical protein
MEDVNLSTLGWMAAITLDGSMGLYDIPSRNHPHWKGSKTANNIASCELIIKHESFDLTSKLCQSGTVPSHQGQSTRHTFSGDGLGE